MNTIENYVNLNLPDLLHVLEERLSSKRFAHTLGVANTSAYLASIHKEDITKALVAGYLHDIAKPYSDDELMEFCKKEKLEISEAERLAPYLLHGKAGARIAKKEFGVKDKDILNAIEFHTTGRPKMSLLEKIVFIADYIEPCRDKQPHLKKLRKLACLDLNKTLVRILEDTVEYLSQTDTIVDPMTEKTLKHYSK